jgi:CRISPR system Cascade subunit CasA
VFFPGRYRGSAPSASAALIIPLGNNLHDTLCLSLVPENRSILNADLPVWERPALTWRQLAAGSTRAIGGIADRYTWLARSILLRKPDDANVSQLLLSSGESHTDSETHDPMGCYLVHPERGPLPMQFSQRERGIWRDFDSLLPDPSHNAPLVIEHAAALTQSCRNRFPKTIAVIGQANSKAKIEFWRMVRFTLPPLVDNIVMRYEIRDLLDRAEQTHAALTSASYSFARLCLARGDRAPAAGDVSAFVDHCGLGRAYWSFLEPRFHAILQQFADGKDSDDIHAAWISDLLQALQYVWDTLAAAMVGGDPWSIRALVRAEASVRKQISELYNTMKAFAASMEVS